MWISEYLQGCIKSITSLDVRPVESFDSVKFIIDRPAPLEGRPNKRSARLRVEFSRECIDDYFGGFEVNVVNWDEGKFKSFLESTLNNTLSGDDLSSSHVRDGFPREIPLVITEIK